MPGNYEVFLTQKGTVKTQYFPYNLKWVSDCYGYLNERLPDRLNSEERKQFLLNMAKPHEDWRVKQADTALRLYNYFFSKNNTPTTSETFSFKETWGLFEEKMREALRLRHRSLSTEKTYLIWLRGFRALVGEKQPDRSRLIRKALLSEGTMSILPCCRRPSRSPGERGSNLYI